MSERFQLDCPNVAAMSNKKIAFIFILLIFIVFFAFNQLVPLRISNKIGNIFIYSTSVNHKMHSVEASTSQSAFISSSIIQSENHLTFQEKLLEITKCYDRALEPAIEQHGAFWVLSNYIRAEKQYRCFESVTYTTQGDYSFLDNLIPVVNRWRGPISVALHAPGTDFQPTLDSIAYLRNCQSSLFKEYVTFHLFFNMDHTPTKPSKEPFDIALRDLYEDKYNCSEGAPYANISYRDLYKIKAKLSYPINVARNVAREKAQTHFVLASDIELYPSLNLITEFMHMIVKKSYLFDNQDPVIFALPIFEILANESAPANKKELQEMIKHQKAFSFHRKICNHCHAIPQFEQWVNLEATEELDIFTISKRQGKQFRWEAVYIGTNKEPFFDERLDWEHHGNKMAQAYALCLLNYDYMVLDNAFLIHKPGIKKKMVNAKVIPKTAKYINSYLGVQLDQGRA